MSSIIIVSNEYRHFGRTGECAPRYSSLHLPSLTRTINSIMSCTSIGTTSCLPGSTRNSLKGTILNHSFTTVDCQSALNTGNGSVIECQITRTDKTIGKCRGACVIFVMITRCRNKGTIVNRCGTHVIKCKESSIYGTIIDSNDTILDLILNCCSICCICGRIVTVLNRHGTVIIDTAIFARDPALFVGAGIPNNHGPIVFNGSIGATVGLR